MNEFLSTLLQAVIIAAVPICAGAAVQISVGFLQEAAGLGGQQLLSLLHRFLIVQKAIAPGVYTIVSEASGQGATLWGGPRRWPPAWRSPSRRCRRAAGRCSRRGTPCWRGVRAATRR